MLSVYLIKIVNITIILSDILIVLRELENIFDCEDFLLQ